MERTILMLSWEYPPDLVGGLARHVHALSRHLALQGAVVHVLTRKGPNLPAEALEDGVWIHRVAPVMGEPSDFRLWVSHLNFAFVEAGVRLIQRLRGQVIIHAHDWLVAHAARTLKHLFRAPMIATIHATEHGRNQGIHDPGQQYINDVEWWLTYEAWRLIVCSDSMRHEVQRLFGLSPDKVTVIPNGIDLPEPAANEPAPPRTRFAEPGERLLFHIGRLVPEKGAAVLLETLPLLLEHHSIRLVIAGTGPYRADLERRAAMLGIADRVSFVGHVPDNVTRALFRYADVAVVPSTYEPFGIVALEAMACGAPLVASDIGGLADIVIHGENGLKAEPGSVRSLAEQINRLLTDRALAARLATTALRHVQERYTWAEVARATLDVYAAVERSCAVSDWCQAPLLGQSHDQPTFESW